MLDPKCLLNLIPELPILALNIHFKHPKDWSLSSLPGVGLDKEGASHLQDFGDDRGDAKRFTTEIQVINVQSGAPRCDVNVGLDSPQ